MFQAQILLTVSLQLEEAGKVSIMRKSGDILFAFLFQIFLFNVSSKKLNPIYGREVRRTLNCKLPWHDHFEGATVQKIKMYNRFFIICKYSILYETSFVSILLFVKWFYNWNIQINSCSRLLFIQIICIK